jgi:hypothetical protein
MSLSPSINLPPINFGPQPQHANLDLGSVLSARYQQAEAERKRKEAEADKSARQKDLDYTQQREALNQGGIPLGSDSRNMTGNDRVAEDAAKGRPGIMTPDNPADVSVPQQEAPQNGAAPGGPFDLSNGYGPNLFRMAAEQPGQAAQPSAAPAAQGAAPAARDPHRILTTTLGSQFYFPTASEKEQAGLNDTNSFVAPPGSDTEAWLQKYAGTPPGTRIPFAHAQAVVGLGKEMLDAADKAQKRKQVAVVTQDASDRAKAVGIDLPVGSEIPYGELKGVLEAVQPKTEKPDVSQIIPGMQGPNGGPLIYDKTTQSMKEIPPVPGSKGVLTADQQDRSEDRKTRLRESEDRRADAADAREARRADAQQLRENQAAKDHEAAGLKKQAMQAMAQGYHDASSTEPGETYFEPRYINGVVTQGPQKTMPQDRQQRDDEGARLKKLARGFEQTAKTHQAEQDRIEKAHGWGQFAAPATPPAAPPQRGAAPAAMVTPGRGAAPGKQPVTMQHIRNYVRDKRAAGNPNFSEADAIREFKSYGYPIGQ